MLSHAGWYEAYFDFGKTSVVCWKSKKKPTAKTTKRPPSTTVTLELSEATQTSSATTSVATSKATTTTLGITTKMGTPTTKKTVVSEEGTTASKRNYDTWPDAELTTKSDRNSQNTPYSKTTVTVKSDSPVVVTSTETPSPGILLDFKKYMLLGWNTHLFKPFQCLHEITT